MSEQRGSPRIPTSPFPVSVLDRATLRSVRARVRNISRSGCRLELLKPLALSTDVSLQFDDFEQMLNGRIAWRKDRAVGVKFVWEAQPANDKRKEKRVDVNIKAIVSDRDITWREDAVITNASQSGCRLQIPDPHTLPDEVCIKIAALNRPVKGVIVWRRDQSAGVRLEWNHARQMPDQVFL